MMLAELLPAMSTAFLAGLLGAGHCFGMCGGIAGGLGALSARKGAAGAAVVFNLSRVFSYSMLGGIAGLLFGFSGTILDLPAWSQWLRWLTAGLIFLIGLQFLLGLRALAIIERGGARLWASISPLARRMARAEGIAGRAMLGITWGLLPCGLVYTILLTAASTGRFVSGALVMLSFGVGTLPALLGMTLWAPALSTLIQDRLFRRIIGLALVLLAAWSVVVAGSVHTGHS